MNEPIKEGYVRVLVSARQTVEYSQYRDIPVARWEQYERMTDARHDDSDYNREFEDLIDPTDVLDADELEDLEMSRVGEDYKPLATVDGETMR